MQLRYLGFDQSQNARSYRFDITEKGLATRQCTVIVDLVLFRTHHVSIQDGPNLCAKKLTADLEGASDGEHQLTADDLRAFAEARDAEEARRVEARKNGVRRPKPRTAAVIPPAWGRMQP
jgi:hypothetical protein